MKKKSMIYVMVLTMIVCSLAAFSQYGYDEEARKKCAQAELCTEQCWYQSGNGTWYYVTHTGTMTACPRCETKTECEESGCILASPC